MGTMCPPGCSSSSAQKNASATRIACAGGFIVSCFPTTCRDRTSGSTGGTTSAKRSGIAFRISPSASAAAVSTRMSLRTSSPRAVGNAAPTMMATEGRLPPLSPRPHATAASMAPCENPMTPSKGARASSNARLSSMPSSSVASNVRTPGGRFHQALPSPPVLCGPSTKSHSHVSAVAATRGCMYSSKPAAFPPFP